MADEFYPESFDFAMPQGTPEQREAAKDFARGVKYAPLDFLGAPVDFVNMPLQAVGLGSDKPFLGSEYLIDKYASMVEALGGSYARPTGSVDETAGRILSGFVTDPTLFAGIATKFGQAAKLKKGQGAEIQGTSAAQLDTPTSDLGPLPSEALSGLNTPELITSWVVEPTKVNRAEVATRLLSDPDIVAKSNQSLDTMGYGDTVPMFRLVKLTDDGDLQPEGLISATLDPNKVPSNIDFLTQGKFGLATPTDYRLVRYDVPRDKIAGYLPAVADDINRTVNRAVKEKGFGQDNIPGMATVTNPAQHAKDLIKLQDEVIADVSGLKPTVLMDESGKPMNMLSVGGRFPKLVAEGRVTTPEDISELMPNYFALNPMEYARQGNAVPFEVAERQAREALIDRYQDFFGVQNKTDARLPATVTDVETGITSVLEPSPKSTLPPGTKPGGIGMYGINPPFKKDGIGQSYSALGDALDSAEEVLGVGKAGMTGAQYLNRLKKLPSITDQELTNTGVMSVLQKNKNTNMSPDELRAVYNENAPDISVEVRKASDVREGGITVDDVNNPAEYGFVEYREEQRLLSDDEDYYEILYNNTNRNNNDYGPYSHYENETGNFGHTRAGIIKGPPEREGSTIRRLGMFVEEHQSDIEGKFRDVQKGESEVTFISPERLTKLKEIQEKALNHPEYQDALDQEVIIKDLKKRLQDTTQRAQGYGDALRDEIGALEQDILDASLDAGTSAGRMSNEGASEADLKAFFDVHRSEEAVKQARLNQMKAELDAATQPYKDAIPGLQAQLKEATDIQNQRLSRLFGNDKLVDELNRAMERGYLATGGKNEDIDDIFLAVSGSRGKFPFGALKQVYIVEAPVNTPPFTDQLSMAKFQNRVTIKKAMQEGLGFVAFPDYRDVAALRTGARGGEEAFKITYKDARDSVLKELKNQFDVKVKTISPDEFVENYAGADVNHPVTVLDLSSIPPVTPRRFAKGGPVDLRSGIGDMFRLYS